MMALPLLLAARVIVWHAYSGAEQTALETAVQTYNRQQTVAVVEAISVPYGSMADKLQAAIPRGHGPDAFIFAHDLAGQWARQGLLARLDGQPANVELLGQMWPQTVAPQSQSVHLLGTCRMGNDPKTSVVDKYHRTHDVKNLFICDGSSLVTSTRGQPTMTISALAFRAGEHLAGFAKRGEI